MTVGMMSTVDALARRSGAKARNSIAVPTGVIIPPPTPCRMRNTTSSQRLSACPHSAEATVKTAMANKKVRLVPKRSPIQPEAGIHTARLRRYATTTHSHRRGADAELPCQGGQRDVDDRRVQDLHEQPGHEHRRDHVLVAQAAEGHRRLTVAFVALCKHFPCRRRSSRSRSRGGGLRQSPAGRMSSATVRTVPSAHQGRCGRWPLASPTATARCCSSSSSTAP